MNTPLPPLRHAWKECICVGSASEILRSEVQSQLRTLQKKIGYRHIRFHASFHDDLRVVVKDPDGSLRYCWTLLDHVYDFLIEIGFAPIVELNPMPEAIASGTKTIFHQKINVTPPVSWQAWEDLCAAATRHFVERYGLPRVRSWLFEVWNEPNLSGFWSGSQEEYYELYAASVRGVKSVHRDLRVGGPACAGAKWSVPFARWCRAHQVPLDFISYHNYPMGEYGEFPGRIGSPHAPGRAFVNEFKEAMEQLTEEGFGNIPRIVTEWNTQHCDADGKAKWIGTSDTSRLFSAASALHYAVETEPYVEALGYWTACDSLNEAGITSELFSHRNQYYGLLTLNGDPKPAFHAFKFLARMTGPRLQVDLGTPPAQAGGLVTDETVTTRALLWNFHIPQEPTTVWSGLLRIPLPERFHNLEEVRILTATVAAGAGSLYEVWLAMGKPASPTRLENEALAAASHPRFQILSLPVQNGEAELLYQLGRDEVLFAELCCSTAYADETGPTPLDRATANLNQALQYPDAKK